MRYIFILLILTGCTKPLVQSPGKYATLPSFTNDEMARAEGFISTKPDGSSSQIGDTLYLEYSTLDSLPASDSVGLRAVDSVAKRAYRAIFFDIQEWQRWRKVCFIVDYIGFPYGEKRYVYSLSNKIFDRLF